MKPILHPLTHQRIQAYATAPTHAVLLIAPRGSGKATVALQMAATALEVDDAATYLYTLQMPDTGEAIGIEAIRELEQFLALRVPGSQPYDRVVIIENASRLTHEAQNALLKTLEEPPTGTLIIMTAESERAVLPTIRSRTQVITVSRPDKAALLAQLSADFEPSAVERAYAVSGGLPGLMHALLEDEDHPLSQATAQARELLTQTTYERLLSVDRLAKDKQLARDTVHILQQMAHVALQSSSGAAARRWQRVMRASYDADEAMHTNAQTKLVLTHLMLSL